MHVEQIKHALDIAGMRTDVFAWRGGGSAAGSAQVDMVIDRADRIVNLCEIKFSGGTYELDKNEYEKIERRVEVFRAETGTKKGIMKTMITFAGVKEGKYRGNIQSEVTLDDLFRE